jgi:hypothetical protein
LGTNYSFLFKEISRYLLGVAFEAKSLHGVGGMHILKLK